MRSRFRAFVIHLGLSAFLALIALWLVFSVWYPSPLGQAVGVASIFLLMLGVDVVTGPLLTFLVYRAGKKSLRFDLGIILALQLSSFFYGLWAVAEGRPAWLVFNVDRFDLVQAYEIDGRNLARAGGVYRYPSWSGVRWVGTRAVRGSEHDKVLFDALFAGIDIPRRPELYVPLHRCAAEMRQKSHPIADLERFNRLEDVSRLRQRWPEADAYLPLMAKARPMTVLIRRESMEVVAIADLAPW